MINMYAYSNASKTARMLSEKLGIKRLKHVGSKAKPKVVINWGKGIPHSKVINDAKSVGTAINKITAFRRLKESGVSVPTFSTSKTEAETWLKNSKVVCRATVTGHEGAGITIHTKGPLPSVPLYVKYIPKKKEFRIHVAGNQVIDQQQKVLSAKHNGPKNFDVRNTANGFVFQRQGIVVPDDARSQALAAVKALGLDFGAVDVIWNESQGKSYVLEVNTAPGLEGSSLDIYCKALKKLVKDKYGITF